MARDPLGEVGKEALVVKLGLFCTNRDLSFVTRDPFGEASIEVVALKLGLFCIFIRRLSLVS